MVSYGVILNLREVPLETICQEKNINELNNITIIVHRNNHSLELYSDSILVKKYKAVFGRNKLPVKRSKDDYVTPIGVYKICSIDEDDIFYRVFKLDFPNRLDAAEALKNKHIDRQEYENIMSALSTGGCPPENTRLGADISIHGIGEYDFIFRNLPFTFNWTNGSIALSNRNIDELKSVLKIGTVVEIKN